MGNKTALYDRHVEMGARIVDFASYDMPVQYSGVIAEHNAVREKVGIFDVSHMGEFILSGADSLKNLNYIFTNSFDTMKIGSVRYTLSLNKNGGTVDDLIIYKLGEEKYMLVVNACNAQKDLDWIEKNLAGDVSFEDISKNTGLIALQGPLSGEVLKKVVESGILPEKYYTFACDIVIAGKKCLVSKTGYTGEDGVEIYCYAEDLVAIWDALLDAGNEFGILPCGLGARDTLRLEAGMPLYGHELNDEIDPITAGLKFCVKLDKEDFIGKSKLPIEPKKQRIGLKVSGRGIVREDATLTDLSGKEIGKTTSGTHSPTLGYPIAMAYVDTGSLEIGDKAQAEVRGRLIEVERVALPFYKKKEN